MSDNVINKINIGGSTYDIIGVPEGGTAGQVLTKGSETDYDVSWEDTAVVGDISVTYDELVELRNNSELTPGTRYRITDYTCTTSQENTRSAGHRFDIIVTADSENTLNENAKATNHVFSESDRGYAFEYYGWTWTNTDTTLELDGDTYYVFSQHDIPSETWVIVCNMQDPTDENALFGYSEADGSDYNLLNETASNYGITNLRITGTDYFENSNLGAWELKYSLDNDTSRFAWACDEDKEITTPTPDSYIEIADNDKNFSFYFQEVTTAEMSGDRVEVWLYSNNNGWYAITLPNPSQGDTTYTFYGDIDDPYNTADFEITSLYTQTTTTIIPKGTGVIYYMKDEWNNEAPYDFKNIQYKRYAVNASYANSNIYDGLVYVGYDTNNAGKGASTGSTSNIQNVQPYYYIPNSNDYLLNIEVNYNNYKWVYTTNGCYISDDGGGSIEYYDMSATPKTFTFIPEQEEPDRKGNTRGENDSESETVTISDIVRDNIIKPYIVDGKMVLNNIVSFSKSYMYESSGNLAKGGAKSSGDNYNNAQASTCYGNSFGYDCHDCTIGGFYNKIGNNCYDIILSDESESNTIQNDCYNITINGESEGNSFEYDCSGIVLNNSLGNTFGLQNRNIKLNGCAYNTFGKNCEEIYSYENNISGNNHNTIGDNGYRIHFYTSDNEHNTMGDNCKEIIFNSDTGNNNYSGDHNSHNILGDYCSGTFYGNCKGNIIGSGKGESSYYEYNRFLLYYGCHNNIIGNSCDIRLGIYSSNNYIGNNVSIPACGDYCSGNSIGNNSYIYFGDYCKNNSISNACFYIEFENYIESITIFPNVRYCCIRGGTSSAIVKGHQILSGVTGEVTFTGNSYIYNPTRIVVDFANNINQIAGINSYGILKIWNPADLIQ